MFDLTTKFIWYVKYLWPLHRLLVRRPRRCRRCILSERYTSIVDGLCEECRTNRGSKEPIAQYGEADLRQAIQGSLSPAATYDAVFMLSGGKDSAYTLSRVCESYPDLRIVAVLVNDGVLSEWAVRNATHLTDKLGVDLLVVNSHLDEFRLAFKSAFQHLNGKPCYGAIDFADGDLVFRLGEEYARKLGVSLLLTGLCSTQLERILETTDFRLKRGDITQVSPLAVWRPTQHEIFRRVQEHGLLLASHPIATNNRLMPIMTLLDVKNLGYCSFEPEFAQAVREGKADRKFWLGVMEACTYGAEHGWFDADAEAMLGEFDLTIAEVFRK